MNKVSAVEFVSKFNGVTTNRAPDIRAKWHRKTRDYTVLFCDADGVLCQVADALDLIYKKNFLTADAALYSDEIPVVVIEHENDVPGAGHEVKKLGYLDVPLGVLITYPKTATADEHLLRKYVEKDLEGPTRIGNLGRQRELLVILGTEVGNEIRWRYFKYTKSGLGQIEPKVRREGAMT
jgi:hypothetical protein